jgi:uncharacterized membrane protein
VFDLSLRNVGNAPDNVTFSATNEGGEMWPFDLSKEEAALDAGREASLNLTVRCPPRTRALRETAVRVTARSLSNLSMTSTVATLTICNLVRGIGFSAEPLQRSVRPGREAVFNLTLSPLGNSVEQLAVRVLGAPAGWEAHVTATRFSLDMNETAAFRLLVVPANDAPPGKTRLSAVATGSSGARANVTVVVEVLETSPGDRITLGENCLVVAALMAVLAAAAVAALEWGRRRRLSS